MNTSQYMVYKGMCICRICREQAKKLEAKKAKQKTQQPNK